jgi:hippurate hydrolase
MNAAGVLLFAATLSAVGQTSPDLAALVDAKLPGLVATYENLHKHPELSHYEVQTSAFLAAELSKSGFEVTQHVGTTLMGRGRMVWWLRRSPRRACRW